MMMFAARFACLARHAHFHIVKDICSLIFIIWFLLSFWLKVKRVTLRLAVELAKRQAVRWVITVFHLAIAQRASDLCT